MPRVAEPQLKKKKPKKTDEERTTGEQRYRLRLAGNVRKREAQQLKALTRVAKKAKELELRKLRRRLALAARLAAGEMSREEAQKADAANPDADSGSDAEGAAGEGGAPERMPQMEDTEKLEKQLAAAKRLSHQGVALLVAQRLGFESAQEPAVPADPAAEEGGEPDPSAAVVVERLLRAACVRSQAEEARTAVAEAQKLIAKHERKRAKAAARHERRQAKAAEKAERVAQGLEPEEPAGGEGAGAAGQAGGAPKKQKLGKNARKRELKAAREAKQRAKKATSKGWRPLAGVPLMGKDKYSREARLQHKALKQAAQAAQARGEAQGQLHPSWQAKRQQAARASAGGGQAAGKKVVFDE